MTSNTARKQISRERGSVQCSFGAEVIQCKDTVLYAAVRLALRLRVSEVRALMPSDRWVAPDSVPSIKEIDLARVMSGGRESRPSNYIP